MGSAVYISLFESVGNLSEFGSRRSANAHLIDDETVAKLGHLDFVWG